MFKSNKIAHVGACPGNTRPLLDIAFKWLVKHDSSCLSESFVHDYIDLNEGRDFLTEDKINKTSVIDSNPFLHNGFSFYKKDFLLRYPFSGMREHMEDRGWAANRVSDGYNIYYDSSLTVNHHYTDNGASWNGDGLYPWLI